MNCQVLDGRALLVDPWDTEKLWFSDDPVGWIRNGLAAIDPRVLPSLFAATGSPAAWILPCPAFEIEPCKITEDREITTATIPALNVGGYSANTEIAEWRARFWMGDIVDGYALGGKQIQAAWLQQVPGASEPDPVYRFLNSPSIELRSEALRFLRQVDSKGQRSEEDRQEAKAPPSDRDDQGDVPLSLSRTDKPSRGAWAHTEPPPIEDRWWQAHLEGSLKELSGAIGETRPTLEQRNRKGTLWLMQIHTKRYRVWFRSKAEYDEAKAEMLKTDKET